jgi:hypothetical protein
LRIQSVAVFFLFIIASLAGCVATNSIRDLENDKTIASTRAVVFWNLRITDRTRTFARENKVIPVLSIKRLDVDNYGSSRNVSARSRTNEHSGHHTESGWVKAEDADRFDQLMAISLDAGRYHMRSFFFKLDEDTINLAIRRFRIPIDRVFRAKPGRLYYLGSLNIVIDSRTNGVFHYSFAFDADYSRQADIKNFTSSFPDLSNHFGNTPVINPPLAYYKYDFSYDIAAFPEFIRTDAVLAEINLDKKGRSYIIQRFTEDESYHYIMCKRAHDLTNSDSFTIEWQSKWVDGVNHLPYGLLLGPNPQNAYYFAVSGDEKSAVFLKKKDIWLKPPCDWKSGTSKAGNGNTVNHHKVEFSNNRIAYSVNDKNVVAFDNSLKFDSFGIGLFVAGKEAIVFDNIIIEQTATSPQ